MSTDIAAMRLARVAKRCRCTGETPNMLRRQRQHFHGEPRSVVPAADGSGQLTLEAALLLATKRAIARMGGQNVPHTRAPLINRIRLATHALWLEIADDALSSFLAESLPVVIDGEVMGIPGLRPRPGRDYVDFQLLSLSGRTDATVRLLGVTREQCRGITDLLGRADVPVWLECRHELHDAEATLLRHSTVQPVEFMSAVLRRFALLRDATWIDSVIDGDSLGVYWHDGPTARAITAILGQSECRVPGATVITTTPLSRLLRGIFLSPATETSHSHCEPDWAWAQWDATHTGQPSPRSEHQTPSAPARPPIPPEAWEQQDMRNALAAREVGTVYRLLRRTGVSEREIAAMTCQSESEVSETIVGRQVMAYDALTRIADGLGVPKGYMGLAYDEVTSARVAETQKTSNAEESEEVKRRKFLAHAAAVAPGIHVYVLGDTQPGLWMSYPPTPGQIGTTDVRQVEAATRALRSLDYQYGGGFCRPAAVAQLSWGQQMLGAAGPEHVKQRLRVALADLRKLTEQ